MRPPQVPAAMQTAIVPGVPGLYVVVDCAERVFCKGICEVNTLAVKKGGKVYIFDYYQADRLLKGQFEGNEEKGLAVVRSSTGECQLAIPGPDALPWVEEKKYRGNRRSPGCTLLKWRGIFERTVEDYTPPPSTLTPYEQGIAKDAALAAIDKHAPNNRKVEIAEAYDEIGERLEHPRHEASIDEMEMSLKEARDLIAEFPRKFGQNFEDSDLEEKMQALVGIITIAKMKDGPHPTLEIGRPLPEVAQRKMRIYRDAKIAYDALHAKIYDELGWCMMNSVGDFVDKILAQQSETPTLCEDIAAFCDLKESPSCYQGGVARCLDAAEKIIDSITCIASKDVTADPVLLPCGHQVSREYVPLLNDMCPYRCNMGTLPIAPAYGSRLMAKLYHGKFSPAFLTDYRSARTKKALFEAWKTKDIAEDEGKQDERENQSPNKSPTHTGKVDVGAPNTPPRW